MKIALGVAVVALSVWASSCCSGPGVTLVSSEPGASSSASVALVAGGARAGFRVLGAAAALPKGMTLVSSDPTVVAVVAQPDAEGRSTVTTGKPGTATLTLRDATGELDVQKVDVRVPAKLVARPGNAAAYEVVGLRILIEDADGTRLSGSGLVEATIGGNGVKAKGEAIDGVERVFLEGSLGDATVHATLGTLVADATVTFAHPRLTATNTRSDTVTNCKNGTENCSTQSTAEVAIAVSNDADVPLAGGRCVWSTTGGATLIADDSGIDAVELRPGARVATFDVPLADGPATATCRLGEQTVTATLR